MKKLLLVFGIAMFLFSCQKDQETELIQSDENQDLSLKSGSPDQPGDNMKVFRFDGYYVWILSDEESGLSAVIGGDAQSLCTGGGWAPDLLSFQDIVKVAEDDNPRVHRLLKGEGVNVNVWGAVPLNCGAILTFEPVFSGTGDYISTDNDVFSYERNNKNTNVWGLTLKGDGISIKYHASWDGEDNATLKEKVTIDLE